MPSPRRPRVPAPPRRRRTRCREAGGRLVAAPAKAAVAGTKRALDRAAREPEKAVALEMAEGVVERLEAIDVDEGDAYRRVRPPRARDLRAERLVERAAVPHRGEGVGAGELLRGLLVGARRTRWPRT